MDEILIKVSICIGLLAVVIPLGMLGLRRQQELWKRENKCTKLHVTDEVVKSVDDKVDIKADEETKEERQSRSINNQIRHRIRSINDRARIRALRRR